MEVKNCSGVDVHIKLVCWHVDKNSLLADVLPPLVNARSITRRISLLCAALAIASSLVAEVPNFAISLDQAGGAAAASAVHAQM